MAVMRFAMETYQTQSIPIEKRGTNETTLPALTSSELVRMQEKYSQLAVGWDPEPRGAYGGALGLRQDPAQP